MNLYNLPPSVIWFGVMAFLAITFGLHLAHLKAIGTEDYIRQLIKQHNLTIKEAEERARLQLFTDIFITIVAGALAVFFALQTIVNLVSPKL